MGGGTAWLLLFCSFHAAGQTHAEPRGLPALPTEVWQVIYDGESRVGHSVMRWQSRAAAGGDPTRIKWTQQTSLTIRRFDAVTTQQVVLTSVELPDGTVNEFSSQHIDGDHKTTVRGVREGEQFKVELDGSRLGDDVVMDDACRLRGFFALEQSLAADPLRPGDRRQVRCLFPLSTTPAEVSLSADKIEPTRLLRGEATLLRVSGQIRLGERGRFDFDCWQDDAGRLRKMHVPATHQTTYAATRDEALAASSSSDPGPPDLGDTSLVPVSSVAVDPHLADHMVYTIRCEHGSLNGLFSSSANQTARERPDGSMQIHVAGNQGTPRLRAGQEGSESSSAPGSAAVYLRPNRWIESDDELIERMSRQVAADEPDALLVARALTSHVSAWLDQKDYERAWDSAAAVARSRHGDCTEHAVLTAALCRARGIPSRIAYGLVYLNSRRSFGCHAWTEVWIDGEWFALDATREQFAVGAGYIKVGDSHLSGTTAQVAMLPLTQLLSQGISIEVTQVEPVETK